tara:strand:- start:2063 stop:2566 length:504 start_codon:yes stop_codon:yes gene_type:complete
MGNSLSNYTIIRVTPTLSTDAYADGDVLFTATEIPNAVLGDRGCSKLVNCFVLDQARQSFSCDFVFTEENTALGTINATADISDANMEAIGLCGALRHESTVAALGGIDGVRINKPSSLSGVGESTDPMLIQAKAGSTSVFVSGVITSGTPTFAADDLDIILHIQYK